MPSRSLRPQSLLVLVGLLGVLAGANRPEARADERTMPLRTSFVQLALDGHAWMTTALAGTSSKRSGAAEAERRSADPQAAPPSLVAPQIAVVVRDWRHSLRLAGAASTVFDDVRPSGSDRMVLVRAAVGSRIAPFVQVGVGQWRLDPVHFPTLPSDAELAAQLGAGVELRLGTLAVATEAHQTGFYRERRAGEAIPEFPSMLSWSLAARASF